MPVPITKTKIILPQRRDDIIPRTRLLELLYDYLDRKLILVTASAGYGKTSLLVDFAHRVDLPVCWYALDPLDEDPQRFMAHFIAAIQVRFPEFGPQSQAALNAATSADLDGNHLVSTIVNEVHDVIREHFIIMLDDYHLVSQVPEIDRFTNLFAQYAGENCHLVIASRELLTLDDLALMIAHSQVAGLSHEELAFTAEEIQNLILRNYRVALPEAEAQALVHETEGWITGLLLSAQTMWQGMTDRLRTARASGVDLYAYLADEVLDQQQPEIQDFLLRSSLLEEFDAELCREVFGDGQDWSRLIDLVLNRNVFVLPVDAERRWVRYHHLFRDFLQDRIARDDPQERQKVLRRLVDVYAQRGEWEKAYAICGRLADQDLRVATIEDAGPALIKNGRLSLLGDWIDQLPEAIRTQRPILLSYKGTVLSVQGEVERGLPLLDRADEILRQGDDLTSLAANLIRRADIQRLKGDYQASIADAQEALALVNENPQLRSLRAGALRSIGMGTFETGQVEQAIAHLERSLDLYQAIQDWQLVAMLRMELGLAHMNSGHFGTALEYYEAALKYWRQVNDPTREANILNNLAVLHHLVGEYERAASIYEEGLAQARRARTPRMQAYILTGIGDVYADLGATQPALEAYGQVREIAADIDHRFLRLYVDLAEANQHRLQGDLDSVEDLIQAAQNWLDGSHSKYEHALWHFVKGKVDLSSGDVRAATEALSWATEVFDQDGQWVEAARAYLYLGMAHLSAGDHASALQSLDKALTLTEKMGDQHVLLAAAREATELLEYARSQSGASQAATLLDRVRAFERDIPTIRRRLRPHVRSVPFTPPRITIRALGTSQVEVDGQPLEAPEWKKQRRVREFFFYVLAHPQGLTKEQIGTVLYPESATAQLKIQFKNMIYRLRYALGQDAVLFEDERYRFNEAIDYNYDVENFESRIEAGKNAQEPLARREAFESAVALYRGPYLADIDSLWVLPERQRLLSAYLDAAAAAARIHLEAGDHDRALSHCDQLLAHDRCYEEAYRLKMLIHAALGNRAEIKRQYDLCRMFLRTDLNVTPSPQTDSLYKQLTQ